MFCLKARCFLLLCLIFHFIKSSDSSAENQEVDGKSDRKGFANKYDDGNNRNLTSEERIAQTTVILFGSLGDLATRYLWRGFFNLYRRKYEREYRTKHLRIYATGRTDEVKGASKLSEVLSESYACKSTNNSCIDSFSDFTRLVTYHRTKSTNDYTTLMEKIASDLVSKNLNEKTRIIYLSVPPFAYPAILEMINSYLRPLDDAVNLRIIFEKPFGHDSLSAQILQDLISKNFTEDQIYRVDHYLGKQAVAEILRFRKQNHDKLSPLWNDRFIDSVEIVMKEKTDCKGRTEFYNEYGVLLDVMQNHLTEIFLRLVMDLPSDENYKSFVQSKFEALRRTSSPHARHILIGQYSTYQDHLNEERIAKLKTVEDQHESAIPTFAAVKMTYKSENFKNTPFFFISGKQLNEKSGFFKINFKPFYQHKAGDSENFEQQKEGRYIKFYIHSSKYNGPLIEISPGLSTLNLMFSNEWKSETVNGYLLMKPTHNVNAYSFLINQIDDGQKSFFVDSESLLASWKIWDPAQHLVRSRKIPLLKYNRNSHQALDFYYDHMSDAIHSKFNQNYIGSFERESFAVDKHFEFSMTENKTFMGSKLVTCASEEVIEKLASELIAGIQNAEKQGWFYHVAFPGGSSIVPLYQQLCRMRKHFKSSHLHLWIVDERCVPLNDTKSNFKLLLSNLQLCLEMPFDNLHPMFIGRSAQTCKPEFAAYYAEEIKAWIPSLQFDMVILGLGQDGHIASLFPGDQGSLSSTELIVINNSGPDKNVRGRMSMTLKLVNSAKTISIIAMGAKKREIVQKLKDKETESMELPILMVKSNYSSVVWYIDNDAYN